jgi:hypothetical protein
MSSVPSSTRETPSGKVSGSSTRTSRSPALPSDSMVIRETPGSEDSATYSVVPSGSTFIPVGNALAAVDHTLVSPLADTA